MTSCADTDFMVRIDPATNMPVATVDLGGWGDTPVLIDGFPWLAVESPSGGPGGSCGSTRRRTRSTGSSRGTTPFMGGNLEVAAGSVWLNDWPNDQVIRLPMAALHGSRRPSSQGRAATPSPVRSNVRDVPTS